MANTFTSLHCHIIFSTKNREPWLRADIEERVWSYLGGIARENGMKAVMIGGIENHVHLLLGLPPTLAVSKAVQLIKGGSSAWIKETFPGLRGFGWQDGYGAFSVSKSQMPEVVEYIRGQRAWIHPTVQMSRFARVAERRLNVWRDGGVQPSLRDGYSVGSRTVG